MNTKAAKVPHTDNAELPTLDDHLDFIFKHPPPRQALPTLAVALFYSLVSRTVHHVKFTLILIPALGPIVSFKFHYYVYVQARPCYGLFPRPQQGECKQALRPRNPFQQTPPRRPPSHRLLPPPQNPLPKTTPNHLLLPRRTLKAHHQRAPNPLSSTQPRARPPASPLVFSINTIISSIIDLNTNFFIYDITIIFIKKMKINFVNSKIITIFAVKI